MNLFELFAKISADSSGFDKAISRAEKAGNSLKNSLSDTFGKIKTVVAGALSVAVIKKGVDAVLDLANATAEAGDRIDKQSQVLGMSRKAFQEWDYILAQNGASIDSMASSMKTLNSAIMSATDGSDEYNEALIRLGLNHVELSNMDMESQFESVVRAFQKMPAGAQKSALAVKLFGKNGMELLPLLNQADTSIDELRQRAEELGLIMSDDAIDASVKYGDALDDLKRTFNSFKYSIGSKLLPTLTTGIETITSYASKLRSAYESDGFVGVWNTLVSDLKSVWPSWSDIKDVAIVAWNGIKEGAKNLGGIVFGKKADGSVDWPTWDDVQEKAHQIWVSIKSNAREIGGVIFGKKADGSVNWPTWDDVQDKAHQIWVDIKSKAREIGGIVFGKKEDGSVAWPDVSKLAADFNTWWQNTAVPAMKNAMVWTLTLFGMPEESAESIANTVSEWWGAIVDTLTSVLNWALNLPDTPYEAGQQLHEIISKWWESIKSYAEGALNWVIGLFDIGDESGSGTLSKISGWWDNTVVPLLKNSINFVLGLFGLPDMDQMASNIQAWWNGVKSIVGELIIEIGWKIFGVGSTGNDDWSGADSSGSTPGQQTWYVGNARGLNYVPYNGYKAELHRGEQVLTASQARQNREGSSGSVDISTMAGAIVSAIRTGMDDATVNSYLDGKSVTGGVSRRTVNQLKARRFAT